MKINVMAGMMESMAEHAVDIVHSAVAKVGGTDVQLTGISADADGAVVKFSGIVETAGTMTELHVYDEDDRELFGGDVNMAVSAGQTVSFSVSFGNLEQSQIQYTQQDVIDGQVNVNTVNWALVAQFDATFFNTIEIEASGISLKIWDYDDHTTAHFDKNFASMEKVVVPVTDAMRGILEFHVKGSGVINSAIAYKGEKV